MGLGMGGSGCWMWDHGWRVWDLVLVLGPLHIYVGLHICLTPLPAWANHDQLPESMCPSCHTLERHLCYSFIINQWASALTLGLGQTS